MPWDNSPDARRRSDATYHNPEYQKIRAIVRARAQGRCEWTEDGQRCNSTDRCQCDHIIPVSQGGTHTATNCWWLCRAHHGRKTAGEGGGYRQQKATGDPQPKPSTNW